MHNYSITRSHVIFTFLLLSLTFIGSVMFFMTPPLVTEGQTETHATSTITISRGNYVVANLSTMTLELKNGTTTIARFPILSKGKPGSYYETIGGAYKNDYKKELHFSSIGHVYMPYSIHVFGNYFIHGIPYYPDGSRVSSTYSGGCIRLSDKDAKEIFNFVNTGTPIIITKESDESFNPTPLVATSSQLTSIWMTTMMVASISLEALTQDNEITDTDNRTLTTRKAILGRLIYNGDSAVAKLYENGLYDGHFVALMNKKAQSLGLTNTYFTDVTTAATTSYEDLNRFTDYINSYKSYLLTAPYN